MVKRYTIYVYDNFHYMDEDERYTLGHYDDCQTAVIACKQIVDEFLAGCDMKMTAEELFTHYKSFGEDPSIMSDDPTCKFSAWTYAEERCRELTARR